MFHSFARESFGDINIRTEYASVTERIVDQFAEELRIVNLTEKDPHGKWFLITQGVLSTDNRFEEDRGERLRNCVGA